MIVFFSAAQFVFPAERHSQLCSPVDPKGEGMSQDTDGRGRDREDLKLHGDHSDLPARVEL